MGFSQRWLSHFFCPFGRRRPRPAPASAARPGRPNLTGDRSRYQCHFRIDAGEAASGCAGLGGGATARDALHDEHQSDRDPLGDRHVARRTAAHRSRCGGRGHVRPEDLAGRVLSYDGAAAARYAEIVVGRRRVGNPIEAFDAPIAARALTAGASIATRDTGGFDGCGLTVIDPRVSA
jgi:hypothetical protein